MTLVTEITPEQRIEHALAGDREACGQLYDALAPAVRRFLRGLRLPLERQDVDDAVQETFLRLFRNLPNFDRSKSLRSYALGIARYVAIDLIRRTPPRDVADVNELASAGTTSEAASRSERRVLIEAALSALDPELRSVIALRHVSRMKMKDLAECLDVSAPTARARVREASQCFAVELRRRGLVPEEVCA
jgi:RNA polymerase sigma-70 factor, ECF subfamily